VPQSQISDIESGKRKNTSFLPELALALGCETQDLDPRFNRHKLVKSFDPDAHDAGGDPDEGPRASDFPQDAIKELAAVGGMGAGQVIQATFVRQGLEIVTQDEVKADYWRLPQSYVREQLGARITDLVVVECSGDSMTPTLRAGDRVIVNRAHVKPSPDGLYAIRDALDEIVVKRLEVLPGNPPRLRVISDNDRHPAREHGLDEISIVGKVVAGMVLF
jgi:hypothetical protein